MEWTAQNRLKRKPKARVSRKEAAAEIESDGRRNEIADEIMRSRLSAETLFDFIENLKAPVLFRGFFLFVFLSLLRYNLNIVKRGENNGS